MILELHVFHIDHNAFQVTFPLENNITFRPFFFRNAPGKFSLLYIQWWSVWFSTKYLKLILDWISPVAVRLSTVHEIKPLSFLIIFDSSSTEFSMYASEATFVTLQCCLLPTLEIKYIVIDFLHASNKSYFSLFLNNTKVKFFRITKKLEYLLQGIRFTLHWFWTNSNDTSGILQDILTLDRHIDMFHLQVWFFN